MSVTQRFPDSSSARPKGFCKARFSPFSPVSQWPKRVTMERLWPMSRGPCMLRTYVMRGWSGGAGQTGADFSDVIGSGVAQDASSPAISTVSSKPA